MTLSFSPNSLKTTNVEVARNRRDNIINQLISTPGQ